MSTFIADNQVPGAALAVARRGRLVYSRGFGFADVEKKEPVAADARFRIASVSKPLTAVAVLRLAEQGKLKLEEKMLSLVNLHPHLAAKATVDPRLADITVLQLLQHSGGWDRTVSYDPIGKAWEIAAALNIKPPVRPEHVCRYMLGQPLDFDPGTRFAYSNLGYLLLGRIIEAVSGQPYEAFVREQVLLPLGIRRVQLGRALLENRAAGEVRYYEFKQRSGPALVGSNIGATVPSQYGAANFEAYEAHGGWIASAIDLVRFATAFDDPRSCPLLNESSVRRMWQRPEGRPGHTEDGKPKPSYYGCGWHVHELGKDGRLNQWHAGLIGGSSAMVVRRWDGLNWAVLFNTDRNAAGKVLSGVIDPLLHAAVNEVKDWPNGEVLKP